MCLVEFLRCSSVPICLFPYYEGFLFSPWGNSEIPGKTKEEKTVRSVIIYIVIIESKYRLYSVKYLIFHYNKRRCVHILLDGRLKGKQINYLLPSSPLTLKAPTPNCCAPSATVFHAKTTARLLDIFSVLMYQHIKRVNHKKRNGFPVLYCNLILFKLPIFLILLAGRV